jgi:hypothetical protein
MELHHDPRFAWRKALTMKKLDRKAPLPALTPDLLVAVRGGDGPFDPPEVRAHIIESGNP